MSENLKNITIKIHLSAVTNYSLSLSFWILFTTPLQWENDINNFLCRCFSNTYLFIHITLMRVYESWDFNKKKRWKYPTQGALRTDFVLSLVSELMRFRMVFIYEHAYIHSCMSKQQYQKHCFMDSFIKITTAFANFQTWTSDQITFFTITYPNNTSKYIIGTVAS